MCKGPEAEERKHIRKSGVGEGRSARGQRADLPEGGEMVSKGRQT